MNADWLVETYDMANYMNSIGQIIPHLDTTIVCWDDAEHKKFLESQHDTIKETAAECINRIRERLIQHLEQYAPDPLDELKSKPAPKAKPKASKAKPKSAKRPAAPSSAKKARTDLLDAPDLS